MAKINSKLVRIDKEFEEDMKKIARIRLNLGLARFNPKELSAAEMTRLLRRTLGYKQSLEELKIKPKRENLV
jgi:hypothetical protein